MNGIMFAISIQYRAGTERFLLGYKRVYNNGQRKNLCLPDLLLRQTLFSLPLLDSFYLEVGFCDILSTIGKHESISIYSLS